MRVAVATAASLAALAMAGGAPAADIGANDDTGKFAADGGRASSSADGRRRAEAVGDDGALPAERPDVDPGRRRARPAIPIAQLAGLHVTLAVYPYPPREIEDGTATAGGFAAWLDAASRSATRR